MHWDKELDYGNDFDTHGKKNFEGKGLHSSNILAAVPEMNLAFNLAKEKLKSSVPNFACATLILKYSVGTLCLKMLLENQIRSL